MKKIHNTNIPPAIIKFLANYLQGRKAYTTYNNKTSKQQQFKTGVPQGGVLSPVLFNIYTSDIPTPPSTVKLYSYADDLTTLSSHPNIETIQQNIQPYLDKLFTWTKENDLQLNASKSTSTLFTPDSTEYNTQLHLTINNTLIPTVKHPKILGLTFDPKLTYNEHVKITKEKARKTTNVLKALTSTKWGKQKETIVATYKAITQPILEYASTIWSPSSKDTNIQKLQTVQNSALRIATGCTADTNAQHLHEESNILPLQQHLKLHASQLRQKAQLTEHTLHHMTTQTRSLRQQKPTTFDNNQYTTNMDTPPQNTTGETIKTNMKTIHTQIVQNYLQDIQPNKVLNSTALTISPTEQTLSRQTRRTLAQLRTNKSPLLLSYLHNINPSTYPSSLCPLCKTEEHTTSHLFACNKIPTTLTTSHLWTNPIAVGGLLALWDQRLKLA